MFGGILGGPIPGGPIGGPIPMPGGPIPGGGGPIPGGPIPMLPIIPGGGPIPGGIAGGPLGGPLAELTGGMAPGGPIGGGGKLPAPIEPGGGGIGGKLCIPGGPIDPLLLGGPVPGGPSMFIECYNTLKCWNCVYLFNYFSQQQQTFNKNLLT